MSGLFDGNGSFMGGLFKFSDLFLLNIIYLVCCLPVVTIGAATTALYYSSMKLVEDRGTSAVKGFLHSFKDNFLQATGIWLIYLAGGAFVGMDFYLLTRYDVGINKLLLGFLIIPTIIIFFSMVYSFPLLSRFENTVKTTLVNSVLLSIANLPLTIMMIVFHALPFIIVIWSLKFAPISILIGFAAVAYSNSIFLLKLFEKLQPQQEETQEDMQEQEVQADSDLESIVE